MGPFHTAVPASLTAFAKVPRAGSDVEAHISVGDSVFDICHDHVAVGIVFITAAAVERQKKIYALFLGGFYDVVGKLELVLLAKGGSDGFACGLFKCIGHGAADDEGVDLVKQIGDNADFVRNLGAAENGNKGTLGVFGGPCP